MSVGEVVRAAHFRGELRPCVLEVALGVACEEEASRWNLEADDGATEAMIGRFLRENGLGPAGASEAWLGARGLTSAEFRDYFNRRYWRETLREKVIPERIDTERVVQQLLGLVQVELLISGAFGPLAAELSRRLVARAAAKAPAGSRQVDAQRALFLERAGLEPGGVAGWLKPLGRSQDWLEGMLQMEALYRLGCGAVLTPERLSRELAAARIPLTMVEVESADFDSAASAREALRKIRENGLSLEEAAAGSPHPFRRFEILAEDLPGDQRPRLLTAGIGDIQEPAQAGGVFNLSRVLRRTEPTLGDALVRGRVERRVLGGYFSEAGAKDIRWLIR